MAGAAGATTGEFIAQQLYPGTDGNQLTEEQKRTVSTLGPVAAGLAGGFTGGSAADTVTGAQAGKNAEENNYLSSKQIDDFAAKAKGCDARGDGKQIGKEMEDLRRAQRNDLIVTWASEAAACKEKYGDIPANSLLAVSYTHLGINVEANLMAHAVVGAVGARASGHSALAGAAGATTGEFIAQQLYPGTDGNQLTEEQKRTVSTLGPVAAGLAGGFTGGSAADTVTGAQAGKNAEENNYLSSKQIDDFAAKAKGCDARGDGKQIGKEMEDLRRAQRNDLIVTWASEAAACKEKYGDIPANSLLAVSYTHLGINVEANLMAHAVVGAVGARASGHSALAGAAGATTGEFIAQQLYPGTDGNQLTEEQKRTVSTLGPVAAGLAGGFTGGSAADTVTGAQAGKNAEENNYLSSKQIDDFAAKAKGCDARGDGKQIGKEMEDLRRAQRNDLIVTWASEAAACKEKYGDIPANSLLAVSYTHLGINVEANLMAHAVVGAVGARASGHSALAGAAGATTGEFIAQQLYPGTDGNQLTEEQKRTVSTLGPVAAGLAGGFTGGSAADTVTGAQAGKNAEENNYLSSKQIDDFAAKAKGCDARGDGKQIGKEMEDLRRAQRNDLIVTWASEAAACKEKYGDIPANSLLAVSYTHLGINVEANLMAHAVVGAVGARASGHSALAGAAGATTGEFIAQQLYPGTDGNQLTEEQKRTVSTLGPVAAGLAGGFTGGSAADTVTGAQAGKNAEENNYLSSKQIDDFAAKAKGCDARGDGKQIGKEMEDLRRAQRNDLIVTWASEAAACKEKYGDIPANSLLAVSYTHLGINVEANLMAHAVVGAVGARASGHSALAGAAGATTGEFIAQQLYPGTDGNQLTEEQKRTVSTLGPVAAGLAGGFTGGSAADTVTGAQAGKNAEENNYLSSKQIDDFAAKAKGCDARGDGKQIGKEMEDLRRAQRNDLIVTWASEAAACKEKYGDIPANSLLAVSYTHLGINVEANLMAHAVVGAVGARASGHSALAGAAGATTGEFIAQQLYPGTDGNQLTEEQKRTVSTLGPVAAGLAGGFTGGSAADTVTGAQAGKNAEENNYLSSKQIDDFAAKAKGCDARGDGKQIGKEMEDLRRAQRNDLIVTWASEAAACKEKYGDIPANSLLAVSYTHLHVYKRQASRAA
ncbi:VENN motif pre-toxin domain-containing protein [Erwinia amylovora]